MKLHFLGANRQVTGSRYCLETRQSRVMIDCGLFQERQYSGRNWHPLPLPVNTINALVLTHSHIDHTGLIPKLVKDGFHAPIFASHPSVDLLDIMLKDAAKIQGEDAAYKKKRHQREGRSSRYPDEPLYELHHVDQTLSLMRGVAYHTTCAVTDDIRVTFHDAGHILGSAMLVFQVEEDEQCRTIVLSGDIGQAGKPLIRDPTRLEQADYLVMESTYGDREHETAGDLERQLGSIINDTIEARGKVIIPTFAVERAQELMYFIARLANRGEIPNIDVYLDSPMAVDVTDVFRQHHDCLDSDTWDLISSGTPPLRFPGLRMSRSTEESKRINEIDGPCVIMSTSGMCTAGRIKHHLKRNISEERNTILFVGYQASGTLGRQILDGKEKVRIHGKDRAVRASIRRIYGFSAHADRCGLLQWCKNFRHAPRRVFLTHGDEDAAQHLAITIRGEFGWPISVPEYQSVFDLP